MRAPSTLPPPPPRNKKRTVNVVIMLDQRLQRYPNITPALGQCMLLVATAAMFNYWTCHLQSSDLQTKYRSMIAERNLQLL